MSPFHSFNRSAVLALASVVVVVLSLSSCAATQHHALEPIAPRPQTGFVGPEIVNSLQPTLSWKTVGSSSETKYDLTLYSGVATRWPCGYQYSLVTCVSYQRGKELLYVEGIEGGSYTFQQPLEPGTVYLWGVRTRNGVKVGPWSTYNWQFGIIPVKGLSSAEGSNWWWNFATPKLGQTPGASPFLPWDPNSNGTESDTLLKE